MKETMNIKELTEEYLHETDWRVKENANSSYSFSGLMQHISGTIIGNYTLNEVYTESIRDAHKKGYIHVHDLSHGIIGYCAGHSLQNLIMDGFGKIEDKVHSKPAKHLDVLVSHMVNYIGSMQMEFAGAQAFSSVDTLLAPFVKQDNLSQKDVKQCMQRLIYSLNVPSRWGCQAPFSNLTFDIIPPSDLKDKPAIIGGIHADFKYGDCKKEMDMINKAFIEVMLEGDSNGKIFTFPIPTYSITEDFDYGSEISKLIFKMTSKYGTPYFQNYVGSGLSQDSIRAMCCRLNLNLKELQKRPGGMWNTGDSTGSIGVVTINVNRLAYEAKGDKELFFSKVENYMRVAKKSLEIKRNIIAENLENGLMPYFKNTVGSFRNYFSTIGLCGMNEACINLIGKNIGTKEGKEVTIELMNFMNDILVKFQKQTGNLYNLEASPAESTSYRFAKLDKKMYSDIKVSGSETIPFLTNSTQLPVDFSDNMFEAIEHQNEIQSLYTGGTMFHTFIGEESPSPEIVASLVKKICENTKLPYFSITPTFSICENHGYFSGEHFLCPECQGEMTIYSRVVGYYRPVKSWNDGKKQEYSTRKEFSLEN